LTENTNFPPVTNQEIDALAGLYADAKENLSKAQDRVDLLGDQLIEMTQRHGGTPPKAEKSLRIEGDDWIVTVSEGQSVTVKKAAVEKIFTSLKRCGLHLTFFRDLFVAESTYKLQKGAQALMAKPLPSGAPSNLRKLFADAVQIKDKAPRLTVDPKEEVKK
jgi:hypothetical protein